ncbi:MAG: hypothetical protein HYY64_00110 [Candidatus Rokubacteria bacterium]|nr:hypothetical protein [Candidatus Rokubacteria bacterium]
MPHVLHLLKAPVPEHALTAIEQQSRDPGTTLTVVLREDTEPPPLPSGVQVRRLPDTLTYAELLDLIFAADQVISW